MMIWQNRLNKRPRRATVINCQILKVPMGNTTKESTNLLPNLKCGQMNSFGYFHLNWRLFSYFAQPTATVGGSKALSIIIPIVRRGMPSYVVTISSKVWSMRCENDVGVSKIISVLKFLSLSSQNSFRK